MKIECAGCGRAIYEAEAIYLDRQPYCNDCLANAGIDSIEDLERRLEESGPPPLTA